MEYSSEQLEGFRRAQRLAYRCAVEVAEGLEAGVSEKQAAARLDAALERRGVRGWIHRAYAWFGDRTAFVGVRTPLGLLPTARRLEPGMPAILDVGPVLDSYAADIGYAFALGEN